MKRNFTLLFLAAIFQLSSAFGQGNGEFHPNTEKTGLNQHYAGTNFLYAMSNVEVLGGGLEYAYSKPGEKKIIAFSYGYASRNMAYPVYNARGVISREDPKTTIMEFGIRGQLYFKDINSGLFASPGLLLRNTTDQLIVSDFDGVRDVGGDHFRIMITGGLGNSFKVSEHFSIIPEADIAIGVGALIDLLGSRDVDDEYAGGLRGKMAFRYQF